MFTQTVSIHTSQKNKTNKQNTQASYNHILWNQLLLWHTNVYELLSMQKRKQKKSRNYQAIQVECDQEFNTLLNKQVLSRSELIKA